MPDATRHPSFHADVDEIVDFLWADDDISIVHRFLLAVDSTISLVEQFPKIGSPYESGISQLDSIPIRSHTIPFPNRPSKRPFSMFYRADGGEVRILYVYRTSRNVPELMADDVRE